jgi:hypothetical protein
VSYFAQPKQIAVHAGKTEPCKGAAGVTGGIVLSAPYIQKENIMTQNCNIESLLVAFFQEALAAHPAEPVSATEFLKYFAPDIARVGRVFKFLGLAEESTESSLGWQPTDQLIRILAERAARPTKASKEEATAKELKLVDSLVQVAGGEAEEQLTDDFLFLVLNALGLLREARGGCKPTSLLREQLISQYESL